MKIYEIPGALRELLDRLDADPDTGEVDGEAPLPPTRSTPPQQLKSSKGRLATAANSRPKPKLSRLKKSVFAKRRKALENKSERLKVYMMPALEAMGGKVKGVMASLRISKTQSVTVFDIDALPDAFKRVVTKVDPDKVALKKAPQGR